MRIIVLGAPGSGKGTQSGYIVKKLQIPRISTGDMLRAVMTSGTPLGNKVKTAVGSGGLVSDDIILSLVKERIAADDCSQGFVFDGFPRTIMQAKALLQIGIDVNYVIELKVPDAEIIKRLTGRLIHLSSGRVYHTEFNSPKIAGIDDYTGEPLVQRDDDRKEVVVQRLDVYHKQTEPLTAWYQSKDYSGKAKYIQVFGLKKAETVFNEIMQSLAV